MAFVTGIISFVYNIFWGDLLLIPTGVYFTVRMRVLPIRHLPTMLRITAEKKSK